MNSVRQLPENVVRLIECSVIAEFATVSKAGVPIDTPTYVFPSDDLSTLDVCTGLSYPAKAERARRNPKVGMLIEGGPDEPVISVRGHAAVRDTDMVGNAIRYLEEISEIGVEAVSFGLSWEAARKAVWYWCRIHIEVTPEQIIWWDSPAEMDNPPQIWRAPTDQAYPESDPPPSGKGSPASRWQQRPWQSLAQEARSRAMSRDIQPYLTICDNDGYPLPIRVRHHDLTEERFNLTLPGWVPWALTGKATLTYQGVETFVGRVRRQGESVLFDVERALPQLPTVQDPAETLQPSEEVKEKLLSRLERELARRGQSVPTIPEELPAPTRLAKVRAERLAKLGAEGLGV